jgi:3-hydroxy-9,10-secoandrosta-1,3,5(10)-triene-9,17-dione monooxygenase
MLLAAPVASTDATRPVEAYFFLVPKHELTPLDDWFVLGMRGTNSRSFLADDLFVPAHRAARRDDVFGAAGEGPLLHPTFALLKSPRSRITPFVASAPAVGVALGAVETFAELARGLRRRGGSLRESDVMKLKLSESAAETYAARLIVENDTKETMAHVRAGEPIPDELRARLLRDSAFVGLLSQRAVDRLHTALGSSAIFDGHPLQRAFRDVHTCIAQASMHWEVRGLDYAEFALGTSPDDGYATP